MKKGVEAYVREFRENFTRSRGKGNLPEMKSWYFTSDMKLWLISTFKLIEQKAKEEKSEGTGKV